MQNNSMGYSNQYGIDRFIKFGKSIGKTWNTANNSSKLIGLQYNPKVPIKAIGKRPVYNYEASGATITNIPDWNVSYQKPKARVSYVYSNTPRM